MVRSLLLGLTHHNLEAKFMKFFPKPNDATAPLAGVAPITASRIEVPLASFQPKVVVPTLRPHYLDKDPTYGDRAEKLFVIRDPDSKEVKTLVPTGDVLQGYLNYIFVFSDRQGNLYTWRTQKEHPEILPQIHKDLIGTGFLTNGGSYKYRTIEEQVNFMEKARQFNLRAITAIYTDKFGILSPFIPGITYHKYLLLGGITATKNVLDNIIRSHENNIVYGDRWAKNTIVQEDESIVEIDFDIELTGEIAQEFEMSQLLYHILLFSSRRKEMLRFLDNYLRENQTHLSQYHIPVVEKILLNYANYFADKPFEGISGGIKQEIAELIKMLSSYSR